jgi:hypothetical protein
VSHYGFGTVGVRYTARPASNRRAARTVWDYLTKEEGELEWIKFLDGHWGFQRKGQDYNLDEIEGIQFAYGGRVK